MFFLSFVSRSGLCDTDHKRYLRQRCPSPRLVSETAQDHQEAGCTRHPAGLRLYEVRTELPTCLPAYLSLGALMPVHLSLLKALTPFCHFWCQWALKSFFPRVRQSREDENCWVEDSWVWNLLSAFGRYSDQAPSWEAVLWPSSSWLQLGWREGCYCLTVSLLAFPGGMHLFILTVHLLFSQNASVATVFAISNQQNPQVTVHKIAVFSVASWHL